jgi:hypothetical protein
MNREILIVSAVALIALLGSSRVSAQAQTWKFAVSGDSRNCGDVVMPGIAAGVKRSGAVFYWHLGDLRAIYQVDEDISHQPEYLAKPLSKPEYQDMAWGDFTQNQIVPFGNIPFYLGIGNHDTIAPKNRAAFIAQFSNQLDLPNLRAQRLSDDPTALEPRTYYRWIERNVEFINLDNATSNQFDEEQVAWLEKLFASESKNRRIRTIVVGMHEALPESFSKNHAMDQSEGGIATGLRVYADLLKVQNKQHKRVYVLASHSHYFMDGTFKTDYWRQHGGVLPGWIVGTAGAVRYVLPPNAASANAALTNVYGFLAGTVSRDGRIRFDFQRLDEADTPAAITARYTPEFVHWCFADNTQAH